MIKILEGFPEPIVALSCEGHVTRADYERVLIPRVNAALAADGRVRLYYEFGPAFSGIDAGAGWEDLKMGVEHLSCWDRVAVVADVRWIQLTLEAFRLLMPRRLRIFNTSRTNEARAWIKASG